ncbi:MOB kinase activator 3C isoform X1 [Sus scrofa]|uniref:MOB kinase activator 3C isoform X1 n=1 Tax=Sus scrofa TaxID=9823 RepID=UPI000A2B6DB0|nr:MOB kinase activator 3C isoform X1 [Sus scrofa]
MELRDKGGPEDSRRTRKRSFTISTFVSAPDGSWACPHFTVEEAEAASLALLRGPAASLVLGPWEAWSLIRTFRKGGCVGRGVPFPRPFPAPWPQRGGAGRAGAELASPRGREGDRGPGRAGGPAGGQSRGPARREAGRRRRPGAGDVTPRPARTRAHPPGGPGVPFPKNFQQVCTKILTRLFRVFVHVYIHHFDSILSMGAEAHVNTCYKHFYYFIREFSLVDQRELEPLREMTERICH